MCIPEMFPVATAAWRPRPHLEPLLWKIFSSKFCVSNWLLFETHLIYQTWFQMSVMAPKLQGKSLCVSAQTTVSKKESPDCPGCCQGQRSGQQHTLYTSCQACLELSRPLCLPPGWLGSRLNLQQRRRVALNCPHSLQSS